METPLISAPTRFLPLGVALASLRPAAADAAVLNNVLLPWREQASKCEDPVQRDTTTMTQVAMFEAINAITPKCAPLAQTIYAPAAPAPVLHKVLALDQIAECALPAR